MAVAQETIDHLRTAGLADVDPEVASLLEREADRQPGETILSLSLDHGGHLTHGLKVNFSGRLYTIVHYGVDREAMVVDYDEVLRLAKEHRPRLIVAGGSAYPPTA